MAKRSSKADMSLCTVETVDGVNLSTGNMRIEGTLMHIIMPVRLPSQSLIICKNEIITGVWTIKSGPIQVDTKYQYVLEKKPVVEPLMAAI